jgi:hypothetical protein
LRRCAHSAAARTLSSRDMKSVPRSRKNVMAALAFDMVVRVHAAMRQSEGGDGRGEYTVRDTVSRCYEIYIRHDVPHTRIPTHTFLSFCVILRFDSTRFVLVFFVSVNGSSHTPISHDCLGKSHPRIVKKQSSSCSGLYATQTWSKK